MRIQLTLSHHPNQVLPINYQYLISSWIYKTLSSANNEFADWLHQEGFQRGAKKYKFFSFSQLHPRYYKINTVAKTFTLTQSPTRLTISFHIDEAAKHFIIGLFQNQRFNLQSGSAFNASFEVASIDLQEKPIFLPSMKFRLTTPLCISRKEAGLEHAQYLSPEETGYGELLVQNLLRKYKAKKNKMAGEIPLTEAIDFAYDFELLSKPKAKLIHIKGIKVKGYVFDFALTTPEELMEVGYYAGFGEKNSSVGMGMVEILK